MPPATPRARRGSIVVVVATNMPAPRLVRRPVAPRVETRWEPAVRRVLDGADGFVRVLGGPGTGKTTLITEIAADRILRGGVDPEQLLIITANRRAATEVRAAVARMVTEHDETDDVPRTVREPLVRTVHSYAFSVLRLHAHLRDVPGPRLLSGPEQDAVVRELLAGDVEDGVGYWPERLRAALTVPGFAEELRDLMLRAAERGLGPEDLVKLGREAKQPEWVAVGRFALQYEQVNLLASAADSAVAQESAPALDAAELVASAVLAFDTDPALLAAERDRVRYLLVDDAQHLDPLQYRLLARLGLAAKEFVLVGDPDQAVFSFRGADPRLLADTDPQGGTVVLREPHRMAPAVREAVARLAARLPGAAPQRPAPRAEVENSRAGGSVDVHLHTTEAAEAAWIADQFRRAHLIDGVPWSEMAVLCRSVTRSAPVLYRALTAAGVPVATDADELPLARQPAVRPFLELLRVATYPRLLDPERAEMLLTSQFGGADPLAVRRLRRGLRRLDLAAGQDRPSDELLVEVLKSEDLLTALDDAEAASVRRVAGLLATARQAIAENVGIEQVLWLVWQQSNLEPRWVAQSHRGGTLGAQADRDLDAIVGLFHAAARYADRLPGAGVTGFADFLAAQRIVGDTLAPSAQRDNVVSVLTAHGAVGREWTVVAVLGVQEGTWPDLRLRGSLLGVERLVDRLAGFDDTAESQMSATAPLLAEERRLLLVAASRARRRLLVSAIRGEDEQPSRFLAELSGVDIEELADAGRPTSLGGTRRALVLADLVGDLRRAVCDPDAPEDRRRAAARQLARLADAGVPGANPGTWYGLAELSTTDPLRAKEDRVTVSPSNVETLAKCPLRWVVERHGGTDPAELASITGVLVHALAQAAASGADEVHLRAELDRAWDAVDAGAPWFSRRERARVHAMLDTFLSWVAATRGELTQVAVEHDFTVDIPETEPPVRVRGRVDRLEADNGGHPVVVDVKTGKNAVTEADAREHPQLAVYQLAAAYGAFVKLGLDSEPGGARLLYVAKANRKKAATERNQDPVGEDGVKHWTGVVADAAAASTGPEYRAKQNPDCPRCPVRVSCPMHASGRQVTE
ncbi:superfamily I DNA/RNA helicase/RecB family exonuclease [Actinophytocola algeriensis]|uniref:DNA 3'-5' helicase n=2 Tax=Actinophytocola algeriensis TaxID=1768010 RepID=A0A7W7QDH1_9PSEU|nr:superfamily I DNA/RNA helicase/RecB family exonuclease [Actinophytocola algeriensis]MBE1479362.1 superfamily I DNA/RNA helicase/RecB family exonuclease [Actinophytocola algeriensis]